jgi:hypothetical protein
VISPYHSRLARERLELFDIVVAENGGILYFPGTGTIRNVAPPPPPELLGELERRSLFFRVGRTIVDMARSDAEHARQALMATQTRMDLVFNRGSLMLLPSGISKGTGVRSAIQALGLTGHEVLALGDAENDLDFFDACDWRACPENAVPELKQQADWVFPGENGTGIARAIVDHILPGRLAVARSARHQLMIGWATRSGELVEIPERDVNVLIQGDPVSGKSWLAGLLAERLVERRYGVCVIDPEGDYSGLASLSGASWSDIRDRHAVMRGLQRFEQEPGALVVLDLSTLDHAEKLHLIEAALERIRELRRLNASPHWVILDEAHYSLHVGGVGEHTVGLEVRGFCLVTCRMSWVRESLLKQIDLVLFTRTTASTELEFVRSRLGAAGFDRDLASVPPICRKVRASGSGSARRPISAR